MPLHAVSGFLLQSERRIGALPVVHAPDGAERVLFEIDDGEPAEVATWLVEWHGGEDERPFLSVARTERGFLFRYHDSADFLVELGAPARIRCRLVPGCSMEVVVHLLCTGVLAQLVHLQGHLCFHASAVGWSDGTASAFLGESGSGKSTLAASFVPPNDLVCDDTLVVRLNASEVLAFSSYPWTRLYDEAAQALAKTGSAPPSPRRTIGADDLAPRKAQIPARTSSTALPLRALYIIGPAQDVPRVVAIPRRDAVIELAKRSYRTDIQDADRLRLEFTQLVDLVDRVPIAELRYPRRYDVLPEVRALIEADSARERR